MKTIEGVDKVNTPYKITLLHKPIVHILLIVIIGLIAYSNTFYVPFQFDDYNYIVDNHKLRDLSNFWSPTGSRWAGFLTFALNYKFGGLNVTDYHIVNIIIHILNALLVYRLVLLTFQTPYFRCQSVKVSECQSGGVSESQSFDTLILGYSDTKFVALFSSLLFVSHPIQTQAVTYIVQRFTSLATTFYLLSLVMYVKWRLKSEQQSNSTSEQQVKKTILAQLRCRTSALLLYCAGLLSAVLAMKTKEMAFTLPFIIVLYEFFFFSKSPNSEPCLPDRQASRFLYLLPFLLTLVIIPLNFIGHEWEIYKPALDTEEELRQLQLKDLAVLSKYEYLLTQFRVIVTYLRLLFLPINQNLDYDYPVYHSFFEPNVFLSFMFLLFVFGLGVYLFYYSKNPPSSPFDKGGIKEGCSLFTVDWLRLTAFGVFWFFITLSVESSIIPIADVIFEHRVYLPSIGLIIAFVSLVFYAFSFIPLNGQRQIPPRPPLTKGGWGDFYASRLSLATCYLLLAAVVLSLSIAAYQRNAIWKNEISLWTDIVSKSPKKARVYNNLGYWGHYKQGRVDKAINAYKIALMLNPNHINAYINLGLAYFSRGEIDKAIQAYKNALILKSDDADIYNNLGLAYAKQLNLTDAIYCYKMAIMLKPDFAESHFNLGLAYIEIGEIDKAREEFKTSLQIRPDNYEVQQFLHSLSKSE